jgi:signal transduction histidine kinase/CheY-like chemotaxis protein
MATCADGSSFEPSLWREAASGRARRSALSVLSLYVALIVILVPWVRLQGPAVPAVVGFLTTGIVLCDFATGLLLLSQPEARTSWDALAPACAFFASATLGVAHMLTFPGAVLPDRTILGGPQLGSYCFLAWRLSFTILMFSGAIARPGAASASAKYRIEWVAPMVMLALLALFGGAAAHESQLPSFVTDGHFTTLNLCLNWGVSLLALLTCLALWRRGLRGSPLQLWLALSMTTFCGDLAFSNFAGGRFTLGWYGGRLSGFISAVTLVVFFLMRFTLQQREAIAAAREAARQALVLKEEVERRAEAEARLLQAQKMEIIGRLTGGVAHDLNNLLTPIVGGLDLLRRRQGLDDRGLRLIDGGLQSAERARLLIQRLLAFSRRQVLDPRPVRLDSLVRAMSDLLSRSLGPHIELLLNVAPDLPPVRLDPNQFELALLNLAVNARDAMEGEGVLYITAATERYPGGGALPPGDYVRIDVADTGRGMEGEILARAVEPFFTTKAESGGTGLGLSMVDGLAGQLGGELSLASTPGFGTTVTLRLPVSATPVEHKAEAPPPAMPERPRISTLLLLVDDEELVRSATAEILKDIGYEVAEAESGNQALQLVREGLNPSALITDFSMPGMSGAELAREIRALRPGLPALIITGYATLADQDAGGFPRLSKPFRQSELAHAVHDLLQETETRQPPRIVHRA